LKTVEIINIKTLTLSNLTKQQVRSIADSQAVYERGQDYSRTGSVARIWVEDNILHAKVLGTDDYHVWIKAKKDNNWDHYCNCPYEGFCCKHVVATCLTFLDQKEKILRQAEKANQQQDVLKNKLAELGKDDLIKLLLTSLKTHKNWKQTFLKILAGKLEKGGQSEDNEQIHQEQFYCLFDDVCSILHEHNNYGGGPEEEEDEVYEGLEKIAKLFQKNKIKDPEIKKEFIKKMFYYYDWGNSGFCDVIMDTIFAVCQNPQDWKFVIQKLEAKESDWRKGLIMRIYQDHLKDKEQYLNLRKQNLKYGSDYYDLVIFYQNKGKTKKALEIAKQGLEKGEGRITDLLEFLFGHYKKKNYKQALFYLKKVFEEDPGLPNYRALKKFTKAEDWERIDKWCRKILRKNKQDYQLALIYLQNKEYDRALKYILSFSDIYDTYTNIEKEEIAKELISIYPKELLPFYKQRVFVQIENKTRKAYKEAVAYAEMTKQIYLKYLKKLTQWQKFIQNIRQKYENRPALIEEFRGL